MKNTYDERRRKGLKRFRKKIENGINWAGQGEAEGQKEARRLRGEAFTFAEPEYKAAEMYVLRM